MNHPLFKSRESYEEIPFGINLVSFKAPPQGWSSTVKTIIQWWQLPFSASLTSSSTNYGQEKGHRRKFRALSRRGLFVVNVSTLLIVPRRCFISMLVAAHRVVCRLNKEIKPFIRSCFACHVARNAAGFTGILVRTICLFSMSYSFFPFFSGASGILSLISSRKYCQTNCSPWKIRSHFASFRKLFPQQRGRLYQVAQLKENFYLLTFSCTFNLAISFNLSIFQTIFPPRSICQKFSALDQPVDLHCTGSFPYKGQELRSPGELDASFALVSHFVA